VANLRPRGVERTNGYADTYEPVFSPSLGVLAGAQLAGVDAQVRAANDRIRAIVTAASTAAGALGRFGFLDAYALFAGHDFKNGLDPAARVGVGGGVVVDTRTPA
jgi:hypothetical protein